VSAELLSLRAPLSGVVWPLERIPDPVSPRRWSAMVRRSIQSTPCSWRRAMAISGILKRSEFGAEQSALARNIDTGSKPRLLVILENFEGWERGADWNDLDFMISHGGKISKVAIVAEPRWETLALAFAGAGVRRAPVKFFPPNELDQARSWLAE
jgi:SpoIIAA-like